MTAKNPVDCWDYIAEGTGKRVVDDIRENERFYDFNSLARNVRKTIEAFLKSTGTSRILRIRSESWKIRIPKRANSVYGAGKSRANPSLALLPAPF